jgi:hypothetical protein
MKPVLVLVASMSGLLLSLGGCFLFSSSGPSAQVVSSRSAAKSAAAELDKQSASLPEQQKVYWAETVGFLNWYGKDIADSDASALGSPKGVTWKDPFASPAFWSWDGYATFKSPEDNTREIRGKILEALQGKPDPSSVTQFKFQKAGDGNTALWPLACLGKVTTLDLGYCRIEPASLSTLCRLPELIELKLEWCGVEDLAFLSGCQKLEKLSLAGCGSIKSVEPLAQLTSLRELNLNECKIGSLRPILSKDLCVKLLNVDRCWDLLLDAIRNLPADEKPKAHLHISREPLDASQFAQLQRELTSKEWSGDLGFRVIAGSSAVKANAVLVPWAESEKPPRATEASASATRDR